MSLKFLVKCCFFASFVCLSIYFTARMEFFLLSLPRGKEVENSADVGKVAGIFASLRPTNIDERHVTSAQSRNKQKKIVMMTFRKATNKKRVMTKPIVSDRKPTSKKTSLARLHFASTNWSMTARKTSTKRSNRNRMTYASEPLTRSTKDIYGEGCKNKREQKGFPTLMEFWISVAARQNIKDYFICYGSLLGAWLHGQAVPYDHDVDICIFREDLPKLDPEDAKRPFDYADGKPHLIIQRSASHPKSTTLRKDCHGNQVTRRTDPCAILDPPARVLLGSLPFLDIFVLEDNDLTLYDESERITYTRDVILPIMPCKFLGVATKCPSKVPKYLAKNYGKDYMKPYKVCRNGTWIRNE